MDQWCSRVPLRRLNLIGETRWWAKDSALTKVFGHFNDPGSSLYVVLVETLSDIAGSLSAPPEAKYKAVGLLEQLGKFETILTAQLFLRIFESTTPLSIFKPRTSICLLHTQWWSERFAH
jgi:hypothetical protein